MGVVDANVAATRVPDYEVPVDLSVDDLGRIETGGNIVGMCRVEVVDHQVERRRHTGLRISDVDDEVRSTAQFEDRQVLLLVREPTAECEVEVDRSSDIGDRDGSDVAGPDAGSLAIRRRHRLLLPCEDPVVGGLGVLEVADVVVADVDLHPGELAGEPVGGATRIVVGHR